jgi:hypothetical protein
MGPTNPLSASKIGRQTLTFQVRGLSQRDKTLFKSFVRLLDHRTQDHWVSDETEADVLVVDKALASSDPALATRTLVVGDIQGDELHFVKIPFHADELEAALNKVSQSIVAPGSFAADANATYRDEQLLRWPPAALLSSPERMRLAALMIGRPVSASTLADRSGTSVPACERFMTELRQHGLLVGNGIR